MHNIGNGMASLFIELPCYSDLKLRGKISVQRPFLVTIPI